MAVIDRFWISYIRLHQVLVLSYVYIIFDIGQYLSAEKNESSVQRKREPIVLLLITFMLCSSSYKHARVTCKHARVIYTHFYIVKLGFTGVYFCLIFALNIDRWYSLEPPQCGGSNVYPRSMF